MRTAHPAHCRGQASVELVALLPFVAAGALALLQVLLAAHAGWTVRQAAESAARAHAVGADAGLAARRAVPARLERAVRVRTRDGGEVEVRLRVPTVLPPLELGAVSARARFLPQR